MGAAEFMQHFKILLQDGECIMGSSLGEETGVFMEKSLCYDTDSMIKWRHLCVMTLIL